MVLAACQLTVIASLMALGWLIFTPNAKIDLSSAYIWMNLLYCGLIAGGICYFLMVMLYGKLSPTHSATILTLQPVFGTAFAMLIPDYFHNVEKVSLEQIVGGILIVGSILLVKFIEARQYVPKTFEPNKEL